MKIKELTIQEFEDFANYSPLKSYMQTEEYAHLMREERYSYDFIGLVDEFGQIKAASLILIKKLNFNLCYGYAPKGFLINYYDKSLLNTFSEKLKEYYSKKNMIFIKINPEIVVGEINPKTKENKKNPNDRLKQDIQSYGFIKLKDNLYFESITPRFNAYIDLKNTKFEHYSKANRNKVRNARRKGLYVEKGSLDNINEYCNMIGSKEKQSHYKALLNIYKENIDLILVRVNFELFIKNSQDLYDKELEDNNLFNEILHRSNSEADLNRKMASDSRLSTIKNEIVIATEGLRENNNKLVAAAFVIKSGNRVHIIESNYDKKFSHLSANYFLYDSLINNYKTDYEFLDLGGVSGDLKKTSPYRGLNNFKTGFDAQIYEYIGEFDFILNRAAYDGLLLSGRLASEFNKKKK